MQNLFTPVEVVKNTHNSYPPEALRRFERELYGITQPRILSLADERKRLLNWYTLPQQGFSDSHHLNEDKQPLSTHQKSWLSLGAFTKIGSRPNNQPNIDYHWEKGSFLQLQNAVTEITVTSKE